MKQSVRSRTLSDPESSTISITQYRPALTSLLGPSPAFSLLLSSYETSKNPFFRSICAYLPGHDELIITSNLLQPTSTSAKPIILITRARLIRSDDLSTIHSIEWQKLRPPPSMPMPASGAPYLDGVLYCSQGNASPGTGGLYYMPRGHPPVPVVTSYFGKGFNSVHSVAVSQSDGALWFTDPCFGADRGFRPRPEMPCHVYRHVPQTGDLRVMADGLGRPTGVALSPDGGTVYVGDAGVEGEEGGEVVRAATVYAFDAAERAGGLFLANKRVFAYVLAGVPMGITCDGLGNVYVGSGDGVEVFSAGGEILGVIEVPGGVSSLAFGKGGELFLCSEQRLWRAQLDQPQVGNLQYSAMSTEDI
ncbi:D-lactonohydrolase-like protein-like protein [Immersiella caudata]|uniref:D-lactonohydrolase-like protein-like protein n=1 Tax=Immersiella caudata TaxID=314043 RepID=A0AA39WRW3_9PEZI|nr:D-lactonohydrolase-like protein-like protein [Immersiella caudata]